MVITDAGLAHLGRMKNLKSLMLQRLPLVTDDGLAHLHGLTNLEQLTIRGTGITEAGLRQLYKALPDTRIVTDLVAAGPTNVRKIVVRELDQAGATTVEITDGARIAAILGRIEEIKEQDIYEGRIGEPWPADFRLDFVGQNRRLYEVRLGQGALQQTFVRFRRWAKWPITDEQQSSLLDLIQSTDGE